MVAMTPHRVDGLQELYVEGECVLFDGERFHRLNPQAAAVWSLIDGRRTFDEICAELAEAFGVPAAEIARDADPMLRQLEADGVLHPRPTLDARLAKPEHVAWVIDEDQAIVLNMETGQRVGFSLQGTQIWTLLLEHHTVEAVVDRLTELYDDVEVDVLRSSTREFVQQLIDADLIGTERVPVAAEVDE